MLTKSIEYYQFGDPLDVLQLTTKQIKPLKEYEVLVEMLYAPLNPSDFIPITGAYKHRTPLPKVAGFEGVGVILDVGAKVNPNLIGKKALPLRGEGTWQQYVKAEEKYTIFLPDDLDILTASQLYINPLTAWVICFYQLRLQKDEVVVMNACNSVLGRIFAQLAKKIGFSLIGLVRNDDCIDELIKLGATAVINTKKQSLLDELIHKTNGKKIDVAIDCIGGKEGDQLAQAVKEGGIFLSLGLLSGRQVNWSKIANDLRLQIELFHLRNWNASVSSKKWRRIFYDLIEFVQNDHLQLIPPQFIYPFTQFKEAIQKEQSKTKNEGKVFLSFKK